MPTYICSPRCTGTRALIGGLRFTQESRKTNSTFLALSSGKYVDSTTENVWTPRVGLSYEMTPTSTVHATYTFEMNSLGGGGAPAITPLVCR